MGDAGFVRHALPLPDGELRLLQPGDAAELPDDGPVEWAPLVPYWSVLWRSGVALAREVAGAPLAGARVVELGCGLAVPSLAAARDGAGRVGRSRRARGRRPVRSRARRRRAVRAVERRAADGPPATPRRRGV